jgi:hypothetical protein
MRTKNRAGSEIGIVGTVLIGSVQWQNYADQAISADCKDNHQFVEKIASLVGTKMIVVDTTIATASDSEGLGELFSTFINSKVRAASTKAAGFMEEVEKRRKQTGTAPSRQYQ